MKSLTKLLTAGVLAATALGVTVFGFNGNAAANASCRWQYTNNGDFTTSSTPVFNSICGVPQGVGNEPDFVQLRQSTNGNDEDNQNNPDYAKSLTAACNVGDKFDIHTYIHNDALSQDNNNGSGSAVAHNVALAMSATLNTAASNFTFGSKISASNADTVSDTASLNCGSNVQLKLVAQSVHIYSAPYSWQNISDSAVNGATTIGSPTVGSGDQWGCWNYRIVVVYQVQVQSVPAPQITAMCDLLTVTATEDRKVTINQFKFTAVNASFKNLVVNWGDSNSDTFTDSKGVVGQTHQLPGSPNQFEIMATANFVDINGQPIRSTNGNCAQIVKFIPNRPPTIINVCTGDTSNVNTGVASQGGNCSTNTVTTTSSNQTPPTTLVNTGPGSVVAIFAAATAAGTVAYRRLLARRLSRQ